MALGKKSQTQVFRRLLAVSLGFCIADMILLLFGAPGLLKNFSGTFNLLGTDVLLYAFYFLMMLGFYFFLLLGNFALRLKLSKNKLAVTTIIGLPFYLHFLDKLILEMLGIYINPANPFFYVPVLISAAGLWVSLVLVRLISNKTQIKIRLLDNAFRWPGLIGVSFLAFVIWSITWGPNINVLSVYDSEQQRAPEKEFVVNETEINSGPNFIVVKIEAFRHDDFTQQNVPFLWELAQNNIQFNNYYTVASATRPSVTSFFTSLYPAQHGCYNLAIGAGEDKATVKVSDSINCLPKMLQARGYQTEMFTSNTLSTDPVFGFEKVLRRFSSVDPYKFQIPAPESFVGYSFLRKRLNMFRIFNVIAFSPEHSPSYFDASRLNVSVFESLKQKTDKPRMMYLHYMEPHTPYYHHPYQPVQINKYSAALKSEIRATYREELTAIDSAIENLFAELSSNGLLENSWIMVTADHGEEFLEHNQWGHGKSVFPEVLKVPAILVAPTAHRKSMVIDSVVENIDIMPTFAEIAGVEIDEYWEGESLLPLINETATGTNLALAQFDDSKRLWSTLIKGSWQIIFKEPSGAAEMNPAERETERKILLFNLTVDPLAQNNLFESRQAIATEMTYMLEDELERLEGSAPLFRGDEQSIDPEQMEQLRALGYVN
jgi:arylsulfatase A-like enzyme